MTIDYVYEPHYARIALDYSVKLCERSVAPFGWVRKVTCNKGRTWRNQFHLVSVFLLIK
jgi:hypothetical protein